MCVSSGVLKEEIKGAERCSVNASTGREPYKVHSHECQCKAVYTMYHNDALKSLIHTTDGIY